VLIDELLVVGDNGLGDGLTDGVNLRCVSTTSDSDADIDVGELLEANNEEGLVDLESEDLRLDEVERFSINLYKALPRLYPSCQHILPSFPVCDVRALQCATAVAVFFLPKHCTLCVEAMFAIGVSRVVVVRKSKCRRR